MPSRCINKRLVFTGLSRIHNIIFALFRCDQQDFAPSWCRPLAFINSDGDNDFATFCERLDDLVAMDSAPGRDVAFYAWIGATHSEQITILEGFDFILGTNDRHRAQ